MNYIYNNGELYHYGIKGQKWGVRRWQNEDGSLTPEGRKRYLGDYARHHNALKGNADKILTNEKLKSEYIDLAAKARTMYDAYYWNYNDKTKETLNKENNLASERLGTFLKSVVAGTQGIDDDDELKELFIMELDYDYLIPKLNNEIEKHAYEIDPDYRTREAKYHKYRDNLRHSVVKKGDFQQMDYVYQNGELYHARSHLYTKREWKNGHWIYWYDKGPDKFHTYTRHEGYIGKLIQTKDKKGKVLTERVKNNRTDRVPSNHERDMRIWSAVEGRHFNENKNFLEQLQDPKRFRQMSAKDRELMINNVEEIMNASGRNMASYKQELSRIDAKRQKELVNRAKKFVSKMLTRSEKNVQKPHKASDVVRVIKK